MRPFFALLAALWVAAAVTAQTPEQQFDFADSLHQNGEDGFAILEFKRFVFHHASHPKAPDAFYRLARLYISHEGDVAAARRILEALVQRFPGTAAAKDAAAFREFIEVNSDYDAEPLRLWLAAESLEKSKAYARVVETCDQILQKYPKARLADDALLRKGLVLRDGLGQPAEAVNVLGSLARTYPQSELRPQAGYEAALALARVPGHEADGATALRAFAASNPKHPLAPKAIGEADALDRRAFVVKRQFDAASVREFAIRRAGTTDGTYRVDIEVAVGLSERDLKATLEDALIKEAGKRSLPRDKVLVTAYFNYPISHAGDVFWDPGNEPVYRVREQQTGDRIKDVFLDILRRR
ncbi:MAG: tetratricopeptide repeat protein [Lentisphaeria bacterium]|nr:tetratricopeptide repeat protein [Lentisphaeria bacterium]